MLNLMQVRDLLDTGHSPQEAQRVAGIWRRDWPGVEQGAKMGTSPGFREALNALSLADRTLKSQPKNPRLVLEKTLLTICK
jgi:DNA polymerase III delta subunit